LVLKLGSFIMQIWLIFGVAALLGVVSYITSDKSISARDKWSLGQIIAVAVWVPCIVEWLRKVFRRSKKGSQSTSGYKEINKGKTDIESSPGVVDEAHLMQPMDAGSPGKVPSLPDTRRNTSY